MAHRVAAGLGTAATGLVMVWINKDSIRRQACQMWNDAQQKTAWEQMPQRIILLRHGQSEANVDHTVLATKPDNLVELTTHGRRQAHEAGERIKHILPEGAKVTVVLSPFERNQQTFLCISKVLGEDTIQEVHIDPRVREQEFGNLQNVNAIQAQSMLAGTVGRFYFRRTDGESSADVYDRVSDFWNSLYNGYFIHSRFNQRQFEHCNPDAVLVVTHGLTMRLLFMRYFGWSVETFDAVYNPGNCDMWVLRKHPSKRLYEMCTEESHPQIMPWATRQVRLLNKDSTVENMTVVDYLSLPSPRTSSMDTVLKTLIPGHGHKLDAVRMAKDCSAAARMQFVDSVLAKKIEKRAEEVDAIDWWAGKLSKEGRQLRNDHKFGGWGAACVKARSERL